MALAAPGFCFGGGESRGNGSEGANAGGRGGGAKVPRPLVKFYFSKRFKVLENESIFQKYQHFFLPENRFFPKKNSKIGHISQEFLSFFGKIYRILIFMEELYKSREIPDELYYLVEKFIKKPKMAMMFPPQGVRGAKAPRMVAKFHFLKRFKVLENESIFQKVQHFSCRKIHFF